MGQAPFAQGAICTAYVRYKKNGSPAYFSRMGCSDVQRQNSNASCPSMGNLGMATLVKATLPHLDLPPLERVYSAHHHPIGAFNKLSVKYYQTPKRQK